MAIYNPQRTGIPSNKGLAVIGKPTDARAWIVDDDFTERPFLSIQEVLDYFDTPDKREGRFKVQILIDGVLKEFWFANGTSDADLIEYISTVENVTNNNYEGWSPLLRNISDSGRIVQELYDWVGGAGEKPTLTGYIAANGITQDISEAIDIKGERGDGYDDTVVNNGDILPETDGTKKWLFVGPGTYTNRGGGAPITVTEPINIVATDGNSYHVVNEVGINLSDYPKKEESFAPSRILDLGPLQNGRYTNIGSQDTNSSYRVTGFVEVDPTWIFNKSTSQSTNTVSVMFDELQTPLGLINYTAGVDFRVHPKTKYVRFSAQGPENLTNTVTIKEAVSIQMAPKVQEIANNTTVSDLDNYFHPSKLILGSPGTTWDSSGNIINNAAGLRVTELIKIRENNSGTLAVGRIFNTINPWRLAWYDANGVFITSTPMSDANGNSIVDIRHGRWGWADIPAGATYFRLRIDFRAENTQDQIDQIQVIDRAAWPIINYRSTYSTKVTSDDVRRIIKAEKVIDTDLSQKSILTLGDSISANLSGDGSWHIWFDSSLRPKTKYNQAAGGATLTSNYAGFGPDYLNDGNTFMRQCERAVQNIANESYQIPDVIFIMGGTNDFNNTSPNAFVTPTELGSTPYDEYMEGMFMTVSPDYNTLKPLTDVPRNKVAGALRYIVERLGAVAPKSVFFVCTPIQSTLHNQLNAQRVVRDIKWMANRLNLPLIDCWNAAGMTMLWDYGTDRKLLGDRVHPFTDSGQTDGSPIMGRFIVSEFLKKYIPIVSTTA